MVASCGLWLERLWAWGRRATVVQAQRHVHSRDAGARLSRRAVLKGFVTFAALGGTFGWRSPRRAFGFQGLPQSQAPEPSVARWQGRLTPLWRRIAGGCHRPPVGRLIGAAGLRLAALQTGCLVEGPRPLRFHYRGRALC